MTDTALKTYADRYVADGLSIIPIPYRQKAATIKWEPYQKEKLAEADIKRYFLNSHETNIAVICGCISENLVVLDCDSVEKFFELAAVICEKTGTVEIFEFTLVVKTDKGYHIYLKTAEPVKSQKFPNLDIKGEGGYVIAPPSVHPSGSEYTFANNLYIPKIRRIEKLADIGIDLEQKQTSQLPVIQEGELIPQGVQNDWLFKRACAYRAQGDIETTILEKLKLDVTRCDQDINNPFTEKDLLRIAKSAAKYPGNTKYSLYISPMDLDSASERHKSVTESVTNRGGERQNVTASLSRRVEDWVADSSGWFSYTDLDQELGIRTDAEKHNRRMIIKRLKDSGIVESHPRDNKLYRHINVAVRLIDFKAAGKRTPLAIRYPFGLEKFFRTYPGNIIALAGAADAGKTAFLLNLIRLNQYDFSIFYQSSEMGKEELASRLKNFEGIDLEDWNFVAEERSSNFTDVIRPDCINIIDYIELSGDFFAIADYMRQIHDKLGSGIAIIALQKKRGAELGRGGDFGLEKPRLYLSMDKGKLTIQKAKNWTDPTSNPNDLILKFKVLAGCQLIITEDWHKEENNEN